MKITVVKAVDYVQQPQQVALSLLDCEDDNFVLGWSYAYPFAHFILQIATDQSFSNLLDYYNSFQIVNKSILITHGILPETTYYCRIKTYHNGLYSSWSDALAVTTLAS